VQQLAAAASVIGLSALVYRSGLKRRQNAAAKMTTGGSDTREESKKPRKVGREDVKYIRSLITAHEDFPKKGIVFRDVFPVFRDARGSQLLYTRLAMHIQSTYGQVDAIVGLDSRGFLFGPVLASRLCCGFVPIRKKGKLPGKCLTTAFKKEYGDDSFEIQADSLRAGQRVVIVDDLLATGGTMAAAVNLVQQLSGNVLECLVIIELADLNGRKKLSVPVYSMLTY